MATRFSARASEPSTENLGSRERWALDQRLGKSGLKTQDMPNQSHDWHQRLPSTQRAANRRNPGTGYETGGSPPSFALIARLAAFSVKDAICDMSLIWKALGGSPWTRLLFFMSLFGVSRPEHTFFRHHPPGSVSPSQPGLPPEDETDPTQGLRLP